MEHKLRSLLKINCPRFRLNECYFLILFLWIAFSLSVTIVISASSFTLCFSPQTRKINLSDRLEIRTFSLMLLCCRKNQSKFGILKIFRELKMHLEFLFIIFCCFWFCLKCLIHYWHCLAAYFVCVCVCPFRCNNLQRKSWFAISIYLTWYIMKNFGVRAFLYRFFIII